MLNPDDLNLLEFNDVVKLYEELNIEIMASIIGRIIKTGDITGLTKKQIEILAQTGGKEIFNEVLKKNVALSYETKKELKRLFKNATKRDMKDFVELYKYRNKPFRLSLKQNRILKEGLRKTERLLKNLTATTAFSAQKTYVEAVDKAYIKVASGAYDYNTAIKKTVQRLADEGITLQDSLGRKVQLEVAVRRNVLAGIQETANNINRDVEEELGCNGYQVSAHIGARPTHAEAQGKIYAIKHENSEERKYPLWSDVESLWSEYGCRHSYSGIIIGISKPIYTAKELKEFKEAKIRLDGKDIPYYEATQKQRSIENEIRKSKKAVQILEKSNQNSKFEKERLQSLRKKYTDFCKETGLEKDYARTSVAKY